MHIIHVNLPGIIMLALAFGVAFGVGHLAGTSDEGPLMITAGPLCAVMDVIYRFKRPEHSWFHPDCGGNLFFIPIWLLGFVWLVLGSLGLGVPPRRQSKPGAHDSYLTTPKKRMTCEEKRRKTWKNAEKLTE